VQARVASDSSAVHFANVPATAIVQVFRPSGTPIRTLRSQGASALAWDLRTERGRLIAPGLYRVRVLGRDAAGRPVPAQSFYIGIARGA
jgi:hypothetical protein